MPSAEPMAVPVGPFMVDPNFSHGVPMSTHGVYAGGNGGLPQVAAVPAPQGMKSIADELVELAALKQSGMLSEQDYEMAKSKILTAA